MPKQKFCVDCKYCHQATLMSLPECRAPQNYEHGTSPVSGEPYIRERHLFCSSQRYAKLFVAIITKTCGQSGRWYKPKPNRVPHETLAQPPIPEQTIKLVRIQIEREAA